MYECVRIKYIYIYKHVLDAVVMLENVKCAHIKLLSLHEANICNKIMIIIRNFFSKEIRGENVCVKRVI